MSSSTENSNNRNSAATPKAPLPTRKRLRKVMLATLGLAIVLIAAGYTAYYLAVARYHETTDDAYVAGNLVQLTSQESGTVIAINADDTQFVKAGEPVVLLDPADARVALDRARAQLALTVRKVSALYVKNNLYAAIIVQREVALARARGNLRRRTMVSAVGAVSAEELSHARDKVHAAEAALETARQQLASNRALTLKTSVDDNPAVQAAAVQLRDAYLDIARDTLPAPVSGYVARRSVQVGQHIAPGMPLMAIVPLNDVWAEANFKEGQLKHIQIGQPVELHADVYGSSVTYHGKVVGYSAGTGSAFAALPAQNATGNWIKVVQRLPVRIQLDPAELHEHPLQIGLSMQADVNTRDPATTSLVKLAAPVDTITRTDVFRRYGDGADAEIARIIARNSSSDIRAHGQTASGKVLPASAPQM